MAMPNSGPISMSMIAAEIGISATGLSLNDSRVRQLAGRPSGQISFSDFYGKSWLLPPTVWAASVSPGEDAQGTVIILGFGGGAYTSVTGQIISGNTVQLRRDSDSRWRLTTGSGANNFRYATLRFTVSNARGSNYTDVATRVYSSGGTGG